MATLEQRLDVSDYQTTIDRTLAEMEQARVVSRLWARDAALWSADSATQTKILNRLGWLTAPLTFHAQMGELECMQNPPYEAVVLVGMGGSSLAPELLQRVFGNAAGNPPLHVLDNTTADQIANLQARLNLQQTLFIIASKSGTTAETKAFGDYFYEASGQSGKQFVAITDPGSSLAKEAQERGYAALFYNPQDIGGRYSVYSYFGLVPATCIGVDVERLLGRAVDEISAAQGSIATAQNDGLVLGVTLGELAKAGRNKLTFITSPQLAAFGDWAEQLIAESTGKEGQGILPVVGESLGAPDAYSDDRLFIHLGLSGEDTQDAALADLVAAGHPVVSIHLSDLYDVGALFFRFEFATAIAAIVLGINPFDEPNVTESKQNTSAILKDVVGGSPLPRPDGEITGEYRTALNDFLAQIAPPQYVAILAYMPMNADTEEPLRALQSYVRDKTGAATTLGFGPRYLHSTGQYHKGGPSQGAFIQIVADDENTLAIPGQPYDFSTLAGAQALGDYAALQKRNFPTLRLRLSGEVSAALRELAE